jgi:hypothetical protein
MSEKLSSILCGIRTSEREHCDKGVKAKTVDTRRRHKKKACSDAVLFFCI